MIKIKPHHFVDILTTVGDGRCDFSPHPYGHAVHSVAKEILGNRDTLLCIESGADDICLPCCHNVNGKCDDTIDTSFRPQAPQSKQEYNLIIDRRWSERLRVRQGDRLTARNLCLRILNAVGEIREVYREIPPERIAQKRLSLGRGIARFLEQAT